jgi:hypothetical protein
MGTCIERVHRQAVAVALAALALAVVTQSTASCGPAVTVPGEDACGDPGGTLAVRAYALALTNPTALGALVRDNATVFAQDGDGIACYRLLATALASNTNLSGLEALRDRAEAERQTGLEFDRAAYTSDLAGTVRELADALPALAREDDGPYRTTRAYESAQAYSTLLQRARGASEGIDVLIKADQEVLQELAAQLSGE